MGIPPYGACIIGIICCYGIGISFCKGGLWSLNFALKQAFPPNTAASITTAISIEMTTLVECHFLACSAALFFRSGEFQPQFVFELASESELSFENQLFFLLFYL